MCQAGGSSQYAVDFSTQPCLLRNELDLPHAGKNSDLNTRVADRMMLLYFKETKGAGRLYPKGWFKWQNVGLWISYMFFSLGPEKEQMSKPGRNTLPFLALAIDCYKVSPHPVVISIPSYLVFLCMGCGCCQVQPQCFHLSCLRVCLRKQGWYGNCHS